MSEINFRSHFWPFQINTKLFLLIFFYKLVKFEDRSLNFSKVIALTTKCEAVAAAAAAADENIIFPDTCVSREYIYRTHSNSIFIKVVY